jgi:dihydroneopterin aldolase
MTAEARIELRDLQIAAAIGTYGPEDVVPDEHVLDLTLNLAPHFVHVAADDMAQVFDYDPLIARIDQIARARHYETQEYLMSRIVAACAVYSQITGLDMCLRKRPVLHGTGSLGVRLVLGEVELEALRRVG